MSGIPSSPADSAAPERYTAGKLCRSIALAANGKGAPIIAIGLFFSDARSFFPLLPT